MGKVYYWQGIIGDASRFAPYHEIIHKLVQGNYKAADLDLKKLKGHCVYSVRVNKSDRLIFTTFKKEGKSYLVLLDIVLNHDYQKCPFLKANVLKNYLEKNAPVIANQIEHNDFIDTTESGLSGEDLTDTTSLQYVPLAYYNQMYIEFNEEQQTARGATLPAVISGPPGSGKSCVALSLLEQAVNQKAYEGGPILYITQSEPLKKMLEAGWNELPVAQNLRPKTVQFRTYTELLNDCIPDITTQKIVGDQHFQVWFENYKARLKHRKSTSFDLDSFGKQTSLIYRELRILTAYKAEEYFNLGERQSLISDREKRQWLWEMAQAYLAHLEETQCIHPAFYSIKSKPKFSFVVVDEAQDLSHRQLKNLRDLTEGYQVAACMDTHQSLEDEQSKRDYLLQILSEGYSKAAHFALNATYRCHPVIVELANRIIEVKNTLTGGIADKKEFKTIVSAPSLQDEKGFVEWLNNSSAAELQKLRHKELVVVTYEEFKDEAIKLFQTPLVFTPEQIKGLEYKTVVAFRLFDKEEFKQANVLLKNKVSEGSLVAPKHRAKQGHRDISFGPLFNRVFTAFTRAQNHLIIVQDLKQLTHLSNLLQKTAIKQETTVFTDLASDTQIDWLKEADKQRQYGNEEIARKIETEKLQENSKPVKQKVKQPYIIKSNNKKTSNIQLKKEDHPSASTGLKLPQIFSRKTLINLLKDPSIEDFFKLNVKGNSCGFIDFIKKEDNQRLLASVLGQHDELIKVVVEGLQSNFDGRFLSMVLLERDLLKKLLTNIPQLFLHLSPEFLTKTYSFDKEESTPFLTLSKSGEGRSILELLFLRAPHLIKNFSASDLTTPFNQPDNFPLFYLTHDFHFGGEAVLTLMLKQNQKLVTEISASAFMKPRSTELFSNTSPFYWLSVYGISLLNQWIEANPQLITSLSLEELMDSLFSNTWNPAFYWLTINQEALRTFKLILELKPDFISYVPAKRLAEQLTRQNSEGVSPLYSLSTHADGCQLLNYFLKVKPELAKYIFPADLEFANTENRNTYGDSPLYWLSSSVEGRSVLKNLFSLNQNLARFLELEGLIRPLIMTRRQGINLSTINTSALYWLTTKFDGRQLLKALLDINDNLVKGISLQELLRMRTAEAGKEANTTAFYYLTSDLTGHKILNMLVEKNPGFIAGLSLEDLTRSLTEAAGLFAITSPLYWLAYHYNEESNLLDLFLTPEIEKNLTAEILISKSNIDEGPLPNSILGSLSRSQKGLEKITQLFTKYPNLYEDFLTRFLNGFSGKGLPSACGTVPYYSLMLTPEGRLILGDKLRREPSYVKFFPVQDLLIKIGAPLSSFEFTPLQLLCSANFGIQLLVALLEANSNYIRDIPVTAWTDVVTTATLTNAFCLHWLARSEEGVSVLKRLCFENEAMVKQISIEVLLNPVFCNQTKEQTTLLFLLICKASGRQLLTYLRMKNPELRKQLTEDYELLDELDITQMRVPSDNKTLSSTESTSSQPSSAEFKETGLMGKNLRLFKPASEEKEDTSSKPDKITRIS
ncbi:DNA/RNA helicase domain-containing protein [Legionella maioricensis]|uniref:DNA 3'-5' helicase II n=1 Tax=Legionella maioricensis TaxID=2896528 RepID=A0A9X2D0U4_9GAMM|nr:DNA/RNA helicase domain-containing protein [Legionella maioricensis]MCL9684414.1 hypothetical protein [Legionella maioricensis]MCL9687595.1 hypothetical protein [Legionella maioricensis]